MKPALSLSLIFIFSLFFSQDFEWGKLSQEELDLRSVPFEPTADAVTLKEYGELKIDYVGYELEEHIRIKILSPNGFSYAQKKWSYNSNNDLIKSSSEKRKQSILSMEKQLLHRLTKKIFWLTTKVMTLKN